MCDQFMAFVTVTNCHKFEFVTEYFPLIFLYSFFSKTGLVTFWSQMSQMVTLSDVTGTNLFLFMFSRKWFRMKWNPEKHTRKWPLLLFYVWNPDQNGSKSFHMWTSQVKYEWDVWHMNESCEIWMSHVTYAWVVSRMDETCYIWMSQFTHERVMSHVWISHVTHEWVMSQINESCQIWMSHVTCEWAMSHMNESCHRWMSHVTNVSAIGWQQLVL